MFTHLVFFFPPICFERGVGGRGGSRCPFMKLVAWSLIPVWVLQALRNNEAARRAEELEGDDSAIQSPSTICGSVPVPEALERGSHKSSVTYSVLKPCFIHVSSS